MKLPASTPGRALWIVMAFSCVGLIVLYVSLNDNAPESRATINKDEIIDNSALIAEVAARRGVEYERRVALLSSKVDSLRIEVEAMKWAKDAKR
jgi:hypothetical protein